MIDSRRILYEDDDLLVVSKLSNELIVRGKGKLQKLPLFDFLKQEYPTLRVVHRLDFETSGVVLFAKNAQTERAIVQGNFAGWKKEYHALVAGRIGRSSGTITKPLEARGKGTVEAVTHYKVLKRFANSSDVQLEIETGRHHQIRKHMAKIGHPLALDDVYGEKKFNAVFTREFGLKHFFLHAERLTIPHPQSGEILTFEAPLPVNFKKILKILKSL